MSISFKGLLIVAAALAIGASAVEAAGRGGSLAGGWHAGGWHGGFRAGHRGRNWNGNYYGYGGYGGYYGDALVADDDASVIPAEPVYTGPPQPTAPLVAPALALSCQHKVETVTVASEDGGDRQLRITRC